MDSLYSRRIPWPWRRCVPTSLLYHESMLVITLVLLALLIVADEAGYRLASRDRGESAATAEP